VVEQILGLAAAFFVVLSAILLVLAVRGARRPRRFCAGRRRRWWSSALPWRWFWKPVCGYDLTGLAAPERQSARCPECGERALKRVGAASAFRPVPSAATAALAAAACFLVARARAGTWAGAFPTVALVALERQLPGRFSKAARWELERRLGASAVSPVEARLLSVQLIAELRSDEHGHNGWRAARRLYDLWPHSAPALERALRSDDRQARILAAWTLREKQPWPTKALLRACLEDLSDDSRCLDLSVRLENGAAAARYLARYPDEARPFVEAAMRYGDWQQRLLGAAIAAQGRMSELFGLAAPILIEHLGDNDLQNDAQLATRSLLQMGEHVEGALEECRHDTDPQRRQLSRALLNRLGRPTDRLRPALDDPPRGVDPFDSLAPLSNELWLDRYWDR
jgi:hypothetical protein